MGLRGMERRCAGAVDAVGVAGCEMGEGLLDECGNLDARDDAQRTATHAIVFDVPATQIDGLFFLFSRRLDLLVSETELAARRERWTPPPPHPGPDRGYLRLYVDTVTQADRGCDFDFMGAAPVPNCSPAE